MTSSYGSTLDSPRMEHEEFSSDIVENLYASCADGYTPAWLDQDGKIVGIFARIIDQLRFWITGRSLIEENFLELCNRLGTTGRTKADPSRGIRSYSETACLADLHHITVVHGDNFVINTIRLISLKITSPEKIVTRDDSLDHIDEGMEAVEKNTLKDLDQYARTSKRILELPSDLKEAGREPYGLFNLGATCFANASLQFLLNMRLFNELLDHDVTETEQELRQAHPIFILRSDIQKNLRNLSALLARDYHYFPQQARQVSADAEKARPQPPIPDKEQTDLEIYRELRILWGRIRCFSRIRGRELCLMENQEDAHEFIALLFDILQADRPDRDAYHFRLGCRTQVERTDEDVDRVEEDFMFRQDPIVQPMISIGQSLRAIARLYRKQGSLAREGLTMQQILNVYFGSWQGSGTMAFENWGGVSRNIAKKRDFLIASPKGPPRQFAIHLYRFIDRDNKDNTLVDMGLETKHDAHLIRLYFHDANDPHPRRYEATYSMQTIACHHGESMHHGHYYTTAVRDIPSPTGERTPQLMYLNDHRPGPLAEQPQQAIKDINQDAYLVYYSLRNLREIPLDSAEANPPEGSYAQIQDEDLILPPPPTASVSSKEALLGYFGVDSKNRILALEELMGEAEKACLSLPEFLRMTYGVTVEDPSESP